jgi:hypothetical protein
LALWSIANPTFVFLCGVNNIAAEFMVPHPFKDGISLEPNSAFYLSGKDPELLERGELEV